MFSFNEETPYVSARLVLVPMLLIKRTFNSNMTSMPNQSRRLDKIHSGFYHNMTYKEEVTKPPPLPLNCNNFQFEL